MRKVGPPLSTVVAAVMLGLFVIELAYRYLGSAVKAASIESDRIAGAFVVLIALAAGSILIVVVVAVSDLNGIRGSAVATTVVGLWQLSGVATIGDPPATPPILSIGST